MYSAEVIFWMSEKRQKKLSRAYHKWRKTMNNENSKQKKKLVLFCNHETLPTISQEKNSRATIIVMNSWAFFLYIFFMWLLERLRSILISSAQTQEECFLSVFHRFTFNRLCYWFNLSFIFSFLSFFASIIQKAID